MRMRAQAWLATVHAFEGAVAVSGAGALWALLCWMLARDGHAPSFTVLPIPAEHYYAAQAVFVIPALLALWLVASTTSHAAARALGGDGRWSRTASLMGFAMAAPLALLFLLPDLLVYLSMGFDALGGLLRITAPLSAVATLAAGTAAVRSVHHLPLGRAFLAAFAGIVLQALVGGPLLR